MLSLNSIEFLIAFEEHKTLLKTAEAMHISQPALTIMMKKIEHELGIKLFVRNKNKLSLNDNGLYFVTLSKNFIKQYDDMINKLTLYDKSHSIIRVGMSAIAPDLYFLPKIEKTHNVNIISNIESEEVLIRKIKDRSYDFIFITNKININNYVCRKVFSENLYFFLHKTHPFANKESISFKEMDGESILMNREVGFWDKLVRENMPNSKFILQDNLDNLRILIDNSNITSFASNITLEERIVPNRIAIEIKDKIAKVDFYLVYNKSIDKKLVKIFFET